MESMRRFIQLLFLTILISVKVRCSEEFDQDELQDNKAKQHSELPILGYVTPWNSRGKQLVDDFRHKFDIVCPVWYTVHPSEDDVAVYEVRGGPPEDEDREWYQRLQKPTSTSSSSKLRSVQVTPRFILDGWGQQDFQQLIFNETRWHRLSTAIMEVVEEMSFDGVVFESGATQALSGPLGVLYDNLRDEDKALVLVMPPIRMPRGTGDEMLESHNSMLLQSISSLADITDYFSIMTYDMSGPGGHESLRQFPPDSQLHAAQKQHKVREPGPNTNAEWVRTNLRTFIDAATGRGDSFSNQQFAFKEDVSAKFLMGLPLYGYKYPVFFAADKVGAVVRTGPHDGDAFAMLRGPGEAVIMAQIEELREKHKSALQEADDGEFYFDYTEEDGYWRVFLPTAESMSGILDALSQDNDASAAGVALWEVGQSSRELLGTL